MSSNNVNLLGPILKCFDTILKEPTTRNIYIAQPIKMPYTAPNEPPRPIIRDSRHYSQAHNPRCAYNTIIWPKHYSMNGGKQLEPKWQSAPKFKWLNTANPWVPRSLKQNWQRMGCVSAGGAHAMHHFTKKEKSNSSHLLQRDKSNQRCHFQIIQASPAHSSSSFHRKQVLVLFMQQIYAQQLKDYWQQPRHIGNEEV